MKTRNLIIAGIIGTVLLGAFAYVKWRQNIYVMTGAGTETKKGVVYELPRTNDTMDSFDKKQFEIKDPHQKRALTYYWMEPDQSQPPGQKFPLVMILHDNSGHAYAAQYLKTPEMKRDFPAFIFVPVTPLSKAWAVPDKINGVKAKEPSIFADRQSLPDTIQIIQQLVNRYPVDPARIYVVGCADGAAGAYGAASRYPDLFAAAIPMSGNWDITDAPQMTRTPMWIFHGAKDKVYPAAAAHAMADSIKNHGGNVRYTELPDMGNDCASPLLYEKETWKWLFSQKKPG